MWRGALVLRGVLKHGWKPDSGVLHFYLMIYRWGNNASTEEMRLYYVLSTNYFCCERALC